MLQQGCCNHRRRHIVQAFHAFSMRMLKLNIKRAKLMTWSSSYSSHQNIHYNHRREGQPPSVLRYNVVHTWQHKHTHKDRSLFSIVPYSAKPKLYKFATARLTTKKTELVLSSNTANVTLGLPRHVRPLFLGGPTCGELRQKYSDKTPRRRLNAAWRPTTNRLEGVNGRRRRKEGRQEGPRTLALQMLYEYCTSESPATSSCCPRPPTRN